MKHEEPGQTPANNPYGKFTAVDVRNIYAVFIDRYERLDMMLRSMPPPQDWDEVQKEKALAEAIIKRICTPRM